MLDFEATKLNVEQLNHYVIYGKLKNAMKNVSHVHNPNHWFCIYISVIHTEGE